MRLQVTYWDVSCETANISSEIDIEFVKHEDFDFVPYQETEVERRFVEYDVYIYGDVPEEIKQHIKRNFDEDKNFYHGVTQNFEFEAINNSKAVKKTYVEELAKEIKEEVESFYKNYDQWIDNRDRNREKGE